jgi:hypothetical protein
VVEEQADLDRLALRVRGPGRRQPESDGGDQGEGENESSAFHHLETSMVR